MAASNTTVSFRIPSEKVEALARLASLQNRDRTHLLNEAVDQYLALNSYHEEHIRVGLAHAREGRTVGHEVAASHVKELITRARTG
jgi:predicted transcriptional regulator